MASDSAGPGTALRALHDVTPRAWEVKSSLLDWHRQPDGHRQFGLAIFNSAVGNRSAGVDTDVADCRLPTVNCSVNSSMSQAPSSSAKASTSSTRSRTSSPRAITATSSTRDQGGRLPLRVRPPDRPSRARVRLLLRRRPRRRLRLSGAQALSRSAASSSPAKSSTTRTSTTSCARQGIRFLSDAGESIDAADAATTSSSCRRSASPSSCSQQLERARLHAGRHHLRLGAERLEEREALRRRRLHLGHPRQVLARGDAGHRLAGAARRRGHYLVVLDHAEADVVCDYIRHGGDAARLPRRGSSTPSSPGFDPDRDLQRIGCANQTTMLSSESLEIGEMFRAAMRDRYGDARAGRRASARSTRSAARPRIGRTPSSALLAEQPLDLMLVHRRLQQQQHLQPRPDLRREAADLPHRRSGRPALGDGDPAQAGRTEAGSRRPPAGCRPAR